MTYPPRRLLDAVHAEPAVQGRRRAWWSSAEGIAYRTPDGREILDGTSGLWCVGAGHRHPKHRRGDEAADRHARLRVELPGRPPGAFELAERIGALAPPGLDRVFLVNSGSRGLRHRAEDRAGPCACARAGPAHAVRRPRACLPRRGLRRHLGRRHDQQPPRLRRRDAARRPPARDLGPGDAGLRARPAARRRRRRWPTSWSAHRRAARRDQHRRRRGRAGRRLHRRAGAAAWATCSACARSATATACC